MGHLQDNRKYQAMTVQEADELFLQIARIKAKIEKETASHKAKLAELELAHKNKLSASLAEKDALEAELSAYILANPDRFEKPRKHVVGQIGTYGITTDPAFVEITCADTVLTFALDNGYDDIQRVTRSVDRNAVARRIADGEEIPGCRLIPAGDVIKMTFKKGYAEALEG